jgi:hypothetical protein
MTPRTNHAPTHPHSLVTPPVLRRRHRGAGFRTSRRALLLLLMLSACGGGGSGGGSAGARTATPTVAADTHRYLFLLYSDAGELIAQSDGSYVFRLHDVWQTVVGFSDRPFRDAVATPLREWIDDWRANGFAASPPNAAVTMLVEGSVQITDWAILTLSRPRFTAAGALEFDARFLTLPNGEPAFFPTTPGSGVKASFTTTQVFVDSVGALELPTPTPTIRSCQAGEELDSCRAAFCGDTGKGGCCTTTMPHACFAPNAAPQSPGWIGFTACGQPDQRAFACLLAAEPTPTPPPLVNTPTATPTLAGPTPTITNTPSGPQPTPTNTLPPGTLRRCGPADLGGKVCTNKVNGDVVHCEKDADCGADNPCIDNVGGCLRDCKGKICCTVGGGCLDDIADCKFASGCSADGECREDLLCDASNVPTTGEHSITIENTTGETIWVGGITGGKNPRPMDVGEWNWELPAGASHTITVPYGWDSGRLWPRTRCTAGASANELKCETGDCKGLRTCEVSGDPPAILAEITLDGGANPGEPDNYNASAVDGWNNIVVTIQPILDGNFPGQWCGVAGCTGAPECPSGYMAKQVSEKDGAVLGCLSPCKATNASENPDLALKLCCACSNTDSGCSCDSGGSCCDNKFGCSPYYPTDHVNPLNRLCMPYGSVTRDDGSELTREDSKWDDEHLAYIENFHRACPGTYAWQFDDLNNLFKCENTPGTLLDYKVTFHPAPVQ